MRPLKAGLLAVGAAWVVGGWAAAVALRELFVAFLETSDQRESLVQMLVTFAVGAAFLAAAATAELLRRRGLASLVNPLGPGLLRFTRDGLLIAAIYAFWVLA